jgi:hypothetical protein
LKLGVLAGLSRIGEFQKRFNTNADDKHGHNGLRKQRTTFDKTNRVNKVPQKATTPAGIDIAAIGR